MARRYARERAPKQGSDASQQAVERLKDAVGRLIARRVLREWVQNHQPHSTNTLPRPGEQQAN